MSSRCNNCNEILEKIERDGSVSKTFNCIGCNYIRYCSVECQVADWKNHEKQCDTHRDDFICLKSLNITKLMNNGLLYNAIDYAMFLGCYPIVCFEIVDCGPKDYGSVDSKKLLICTDQTEAKNTCVCLFNKSQILMYINKVTNGITTTFKAIHAFGKTSYDEYSSSDEEH